MVKTTRYSASLLGVSSWLVQMELQPVWQLHPSLAVSCIPANSLSGSFPSHFLVLSTIPWAFSDAGRSLATLYVEPFLVPQDPKNRLGWHGRPLCDQFLGEGIEKVVLPWLPCKVMPSVILPGLFNPRNSWQGPCYLPHLELSTTNIFSIEQCDKKIPGASCSSR